MTTPPTNRSVRTQQLPPDDPAPRSTCRRCGAGHAVDERFCESCGNDNTDPGTWSVEISVDQTYCERAASGLACPTGRVPVVREFDGDEITIGRRSETRGLEPDVDLSGQLADPAVSHAHARIRRDRVSGGFMVTDLGSTNGTTINDDDTLLEPNALVALSAGDRVHVGAWTTISIRS